MNLQSGKYYRLADGTIVKAQGHRGDKMVAYTADGTQIYEGMKDDHVNGWEPASAVNWKEARAEVAKAKQASKTPVAKKAAKKKAKKKVAKKKGD